MVDKNEQMSFNFDLYIDKANHPFKKLSKDNNKKTIDNKRSSNINTLFSQRFWNYSFTSDNKFVIDYFENESKTIISEDFINKFIDNLKLGFSSERDLKNHYSEHLNSKYYDKIKDTFVLLNYYTQNNSLDIKTVSQWFEYYKASDVYKFLMYLTGNYNKILTQDELKELKEKRKLLRNIEFAVSKTKKLYKNKMSIEEITKTVDEYIKDDKINNQIKNIISNQLLYSKSTNKIQALNMAFDELKSKLVPDIPASIKEIQSKLLNIEKIKAFNEDYKQYKKNSIDNNKNFMTNFDIVTTNDYFTITSFNVNFNCKVFNHKFKHDKNNGPYENVDKHCIIYINEYYLNDYSNHMEVQEKLIETLNKIFPHYSKIHLCVNDKLPEKLDNETNSSRISILKVPNKPMQQKKIELNQLNQEISNHFENTRKMLKKM